MRSYLRALIVLHRAYASLPPASRIHILVRFLTCPFLRVVRRIPASAQSLLEIGGGHGVFARLAAERGVRSVVIEPDTRKLFQLRGRSTPVRYVAGFDHAVQGSFDVVAVIDVLYAIPITEWDPILSRAATRLSAGGTLLVKEMNPHSWKQRWNRLQETISMRFLGITYAVTFNYEGIADFKARLERHGFTDVETIAIDGGYPHPHVLFVAQMPVTGSR